MGARVVESSPFLSGAMILAYEGLAILTGRVPTISRIMAYNLDAHPPVVSGFYGFLAGVVLCALALHFAGMLSWWRP